MKNIINILNISVLYCFQINWLRLLQILAGSHGKLVRPAFKIYIDEDYLSQLCDIIGRTSKEIICELNSSVIYSFFNKFRNILFFLYRSDN